MNTITGFLVSLDDPWINQSSENAVKRTLDRKTHEMVLVGILTMAEAGLSGLLLGRPALANKWVHFLALCALLRGAFGIARNVWAILGFVCHLTCLVVVLADGPFYAAAVACWLATLTSFIRRNGQGGHSIVF